MTTQIRITQKIPLFGKGNTLESRLRQVKLRGFPEVAIYKNADFTLRPLRAAEVPQVLATPQPHIHQTYLDRIAALANPFAKEGVDIFHLDHAYDYLATDESGEHTQWTMIPPIVEHFSIPAHPAGGYDYRPLLGPDLQTEMAAHGWAIEPRTTTIPRVATEVRLMNDGSHRVHAGLLSGKGITVVEVQGMTPGYPYYAAPQPYASVRVFPEEATSEDLKIHVLTSPGHKQLYRLFPSGGILTGVVRPAREGEVFV